MRFTVHASETILNALEDFALRLMEKSAVECDKRRLNAGQPLKCGMVLPRDMESALMLHLAPPPHPPVATAEMVWSVYGDP